MVRPMDSSTRIDMVIRGLIGNNTDLFSQNPYFRYAIYQFANGIITVVDNAVKTDDLAREFSRREVAFFDPNDLTW